ncbi:MAG: DUF4338 domain-containing protein [Verrucomicrobiales bacterium]|nr:DUF4338 domain-containing protein [Verrucomicrobiales bacterium]
MAGLQPLQVERVEAGTEAAGRWRFYLHRYHYLGLRVVGENLGYLVRAATGQDVACLLFGAAAWRCAPRDQALGWDEAERRRGTAPGGQQHALLILPWVRVPQLAQCGAGGVPPPCRLAGQSTATGWTCQDLRGAGSLQAPAIGQPMALAQDDPQTPAAGTATTGAPCQSERCCTGFWPTR